jgi:hypothetical protein
MPAKESAKRVQFVVQLTRKYAMESASLHLQHVVCSTPAQTEVVHLQRTTVAAHLVKPNALITHVQQAVLKSAQQRAKYCAVQEDVPPIQLLAIANQDNKFVKEPIHVPLHAVQSAAQEMVSVYNRFLSAHKPVNAHRQMFSATPSVSQI